MEKEGSYNMSLVFLAPLLKLLSQQELLRGTVWCPYGHTHIATLELTGYIQARPGRYPSERQQHKGQRGHPPQSVRAENKHER